MTTSYVQRAIDVTVQLGHGSYGEDGFDTVKLTGLRVVATIEKLGPPGAAHADIRIYGMTDSVMNKLSTLGTMLNLVRDNTVTVEAGDAVNGMAAVYTGTLTQAWQNFDGMPDTFFNILCFTALLDAMRPVPAISFNGVADVATIMSGIAVQMQRVFENNNVQVKLSNPYFAGTALEQAQSCARAADIEMFDDGWTLAIWPKNTGRKGVVPIISAASGLIGYPQFSSQGIRFRTLYNPSIKFGGFIEMQSSMKPACGSWYVNELTYDLSSQLVDGPWFCEVGAVRLPAPAR